MPLGRQLFRRSLAEALGALLEQKYRTAKELHRGVGIDITTAENLRKGHLSVTTLQKVLSAEGRSLWNALGDELFGESFYEFEERRIAAAIKEAEDARSNLVRLRASGEAVLSGAPSMAQAVAREAALQVRSGEGRSWRKADGASDLGTPRSRDRGGR